MVEEATKALAEAENDDTVKVVIFTGGLPDVFIRHFSVEEIILMTEAVRDHRRRGLAEPRFARTALRMFWENGRQTFESPPWHNQWLLWWWWM